MSTPIYGPTVSAMTNPGGAPESPPPMNPATDLDSQVAAIVNARLADIEAKYQDRIAALEQAVKDAQSGVVTSAHPAHSGGPGLQHAQTWGQYYQELSKAGQLTEDILHKVGL